jgi:hypothetical protein
MPRISRFFGISIAMYYDDHSPPHFHVIYSGHEAQVALDDWRVLQGDASSRVMTLVRECAEMHSAELRDDWELARRGLPLNPVAPLD